MAMYKKLIGLILLITALTRADFSVNAMEFINGTIDPNYNFKIGYGAVNKDIIGGVTYDFAWDLFYVRVTKDDSTWRFRSPMGLFALNVIGLTFVDENKGWLLNPGYPLVLVLPSLPMMLMNPTISVYLSSWLKFGIGYNSDFYAISWFTRFDEVYFAPKVQTTIMLGPKAHITAQLNYQVKDFFSTAKGWHFTLMYSTWIDHVHFFL